MTLETMAPNPVWDAESYPDAVSTLEHHAADLTVKVWGADWCKDCRAVLPDFAAALEAASIPDDRIEQYPVEREDGEKVGPGVDEYNVALIPTIVIERENTEVARFVESEPEPAITVLADQLDAPQTPT
jgi:thioredoxin 1